MKRNVYFSHDGSMDDYVALLCLMAMNDMHITGIGVINGDCYVEPGVSVTRKMIDVFGGYPIEVAASVARPKNQFPNAWRAEAFRIDAFPILNDIDGINTPLSPLPAHQHMAKVIRETEGMTDIFAIGALSDVAMMLEEAPELKDKIAKIMWMGGAFETGGNVNIPDHDGSAEWNVFWDPQAAADVLASGIPITTASLDSTNQCPWSIEMQQQWATLRRYEAIDFCAQMYCTVVYFGSSNQDTPYFFWDTLAAAFYGDPTLATTKEVLCTIATNGRSQGQTKIDPNGKPITMLDRVQSQRVFEVVTALLKTYGLNPYMR